MRKKLLVVFTALIFLVVQPFPILQKLASEHEYKDVHIEVERIANAIDVYSNCYGIDKIGMQAFHTHCYLHNDYDYEIISEPIELTTKDLESKHYLFFTKMKYGTVRNGEYGYIEVKALGETPATYALRLRGRGILANFDKKQNLIPYEIVKYNLSAGNLISLSQTNIATEDSLTFQVKGMGTLLFVKPSNLEETKISHTVRTMGLFNSFELPLFYRSRGVGSYVYIQ